MQRCPASRLPGLLVRSAMSRKCQTSVLEWAFPGVAGISSLRSNSARRTRHRHDCPGNPGEPASPRQKSKRRPEFMLCREPGLAPWPRRILVNWTHHIFRRTSTKSRACRVDHQLRSSLPFREQAPFRGAVISIIVSVVKPWAPHTPHSRHTAHAAQPSAAR
jgi:hypothetical protein